MFRVSVSTIALVFAAGLGTGFAAAAVAVNMPVEDPNTFSVRRLVEPTTTPPQPAVAVSACAVPVE